MFGWLFKKKIEVKNDKDLMSSVYQSKGFKIGTEIIVPEQFEALIYYKGKMCASLSAGKYTLDSSCINKLISKIKKPKIKYIKCVLHYISKAPQTLQITIKKVKYAVNFSIDDSHKFAELILLYTFKANKDYVLEYVSEIFEEAIKSSHFDLNKIPSLETYGIKIIKITNIQKNNFTNFESKQDASNKDISIDSANVTTLSNHELNKTSASTCQDTNTKTCPKCHYPIKFATKYCLKCGTNLEENQ